MTASSIVSSSFLACNALTIPETGPAQARRAACFCPILSVFEAAALTAAHAVV